MPGKKKLPPYPRKRAGAELVLKQNLHFHSASADGLKSGVFLLGNRNGLRWLSEYFAWLADRIDEQAPYNRLDPDDHQHVDSDGPFNHRLSDTLGFTIGAFPLKYRTRVFKACGISSRERLPGCPITQFREALAWITKLLAEGPGGEEARPQVIERLEQLTRHVEDSIRALKSAADPHEGQE